MCNKRTLRDGQLQCDEICSRLAKINTQFEESGVGATRAQIEELEKIVKAHAVGGHRNGYYNH